MKNSWVLRKSVSKNLASVSHTGSTVLAEGWKVPSWMIHVHANQNLAYFEMLLWVHFLSVCFPGDPKDFQSERAEQLRNYFRNLHCQGLIWWDHRGNLTLFLLLPEKYIPRNRYFMRLASMLWTQSLHTSHCWLGPNGGEIGHIIMACSNSVIPVDSSSNLTRSSEDFYMHIWDKLQLITFFVLVVMGIDNSCLW